MARTQRRQDGVSVNGLGDVRAFARNMMTDADLSAEVAERHAEASEPERRASMPLGDDRRAHSGEAFIFERFDGLTPSLWGDGSKLLWSAGEGLMIAAEQGTGKSTVAQQLLLHRSGVLDGDFLGFPVTPLERDRCDLYVALDRPRQISASLRRMVAVDDRRARRLVRERLAIWEGPLPFSILADPNLLAEWIDWRWPDSGAVVLDSVKDLAPGRPLTSDEVATALNAAWQSVLVSGRELLLLHHHRKTAAGTADGAPKSLADVFGSTFLTAGLGSVLTFQGRPGDERVKLRQLKMPKEEVGPFQVMHDHVAGLSVGEPQKDMLVFLSSCGGAGATLREAAMYMCGGESRRELERTRRALKVLIDEGVARHVAGSSGGVGSGGRGGGEPGRWFTVV